MSLAKLRFRNQFVNKKLRINGNIDDGNKYYLFFHFLDIKCNAILIN